MPAITRYRAFLSTSIRPQDQPLVDVLRSVLDGQGFECITVGLDVSAPESTAETAKKEMERCECLIVLATKRFDAQDVHTGDPVSLASGWIDSETGMAHMRGIPITSFKDQAVQLQGLLAANITQWFAFDPRQETFVAYLLRNQPLVRSHLSEVKRRIDEARDRNRATWIGRLLKWGLALFTTGAVVYGATRPEDESEFPCFGTHDGRLNVCKSCPVRDRCKRLRDARK
jgi:hypothetical protein